MIVQVQSIRHRGLRVLIEENSPRLLGPDLAGRVRNTVLALSVADDLDQFIKDAPPGWRVHRLSGNRQNDWSVSVSGNWRITFQEEGGFIYNLNLEDYH